MHDNFQSKIQVRRLLLVGELAEESFLAVGSQKSPAPAFAALAYATAPSAFAAFTAIN
jgi:hypothetical protein